MAPADAERGFAFIAFNCPVYSLAVLVTNLGANVRCIDSWLLAGCKPMPYPTILAIHAPILDCGV
jgi:hypothetical protein